VTWWVRCGEQFTPAHMPLTCPTPPPTVMGQGGFRYQRLNAFDCWRLRRYPPHRPFPTTAPGAPSGGRRCGIPRNFYRWFPYLFSTGLVGGYVDERMHGGLQPHTLLYHHTPPVYFTGTTGSIPRPGWIYHCSGEPAMTRTSKVDPTTGRYPATYRFSTGINDMVAGVEHE